MLARGTQSAARMTPRNRPQFLSVFPSGEAAPSSMLKALPSAGNSPRHSLVHLSTGHCRTRASMRSNRPHFRAGAEAVLRPRSIATPARLGGCYSAAAALTGRGWLGASPARFVVSNARTARRGWHHSLHKSTSQTEKSSMCL